MAFSIYTNRDLTEMEELVNKAEFNIISNKNTPKESFSLYERPLANSKSRIYKLNLN